MTPACSNTACAACRADRDEQRRRDELVDRVARRGLALGCMVGILLGFMLGVVIATARLL